MDSFSFPADTINVVDAPEALTEELLSSLLWALDKGKYRQDCYISEDSISPKTSFNLDSRYMPSHCVSWATNTFQEMLDLHGIKRQSFDVESWWNYYPKMTSHESHNHVADTLSGIWTMSDNQDSGTVFMKDSFSSLTRESLQQIKIDTVKSKFIVFPSHLMHYTLPSSHDRYTAAFNCRCL